MESLAVLRELPGSFEVEVRPRSIFAVQGDLAARMRDAGYGPESDGRRRASDLAGRAPLDELELDGARFVVRRFSHGGLLRWLTGTRFRDPERPFRELVHADRLARAGIAAAPVVAARACRAAWFGWRLEVVTRRIDGAIDLGRALGGGDLRAGVRAALLREAGRFVGQLHRLGFVHADLHPRNLLINADALRGAPPRLCAIDLDRSVWRATLGDRERRDNLRRLLRYAAREWSPSARDLARFLSAYQPARRKRHEDWRAIAALHRRARWLHAAGWCLERWLGRRA